MLAFFVIPAARVHGMAGNMPFGIDVPGRAGIVTAEI